MTVVRYHELVPDTMMRGLRTYVDVRGASPGLPDKKLGEHMQLRTRSAPQLLRETGQGIAEICVDLPSTSRTDGSYRVIVFQSGRRLCRRVVPVADVVRDRERL